MPIYEQIKEQIIMLINTGVYKADDRLPSIRFLSNELNINVNTIKRAFSELESMGVTYSVPGKGVFVCENPAANSRIRENAINDIKTVIRSGKAKGVTRQDLLDVIGEIFKTGDNL